MALESKVQVNIKIPMKGKGGKIANRFFTTILPHPSSMSNLVGRQCVLGTAFQTCHKIFLGERSFSIRATSYSHDDERDLMKLIKNIHIQGNPHKIAVKLRAAAKPTRKRMSLFMILPLQVVAGYDEKTNSLRWMWKSEYHMSEIQNMNLQRIADVPELIGSAEEVKQCDVGNFEIIHGTCAPTQIVSETLKKRKGEFVEEIRGRAEDAQKRRLEREAKANAVAEITGMNPNEQVDRSSKGSDSDSQPIQATKRSFANVKLNINL